MNTSEITYKKSAQPRVRRIDKDVLQNTTRASNATIWFTGENILKKFPGFTVLKYSLAAAMESGILLPHDLASIREVYRFTKRSPAAIVIDVNKMSVFIFFCKDEPDRSICRSFL